MRKYGTESNKDIFDFDGDSDGGVEIVEEEELPPPQTGSSWAMSSGDTLALGSSNPLQAKPTDRDKDTMGLTSMPPPASKSTSFEHTQVLETDKVARMWEGNSEDTPAKLRQTKEASSFRSTFSSDRVPTSTIYSYRSDEQQAQEIHAMDVAQERSRLNSDVASPEPVGPSSSSSVFSPSKMITVDHKTVAAIDPLKDSVTGNYEASSVPTNSIREITNGAAVITDNSQNLEDRDELSFPEHGPATWSINQTTLSKAQARKTDNDEPHANEASSDDVAIGLPKDQYKPRPSRSRSGRGNEEVIMPADFSKKPEAMAKKKEKLFKRSKTTAFQELMPKIEDDEEHDDAVNKPWIESPHAIPPRDSVEGLTNPQSNEKVDQNVAVTELVPEPKPLKKQRGRPKKAASAKLSEAQITDIPVTEKTQDDANTTNPNDAALNKKAKKGANAKIEPVVRSEELVHDSGDELDDLHDMKHNLDKVLDEKSGNRVISPPEEKVPPLKASASSPETPQKAASPAEKGPDKHSPISSGKVAYRIGLSKRARIAPLLRIVRKA